MNDSGKKITKGRKAVAKKKSCEEKRLRRKKAAKKKVATKKVEKKGCEEKRERLRDDETAPEEENAGKAKWLWQKKSKFEQKRGRETA